MGLQAFDVCPPTQWRAGFVGDRPFFFGCAQCEEKDAEIAGCLSQDGTFRGVGIITKPATEGRPFPTHHPALFCRECWEKRKGGGS